MPHLFQHILYLLMGTGDCTKTVSNPKQFLVFIVKNLNSHISHCLFHLKTVMYVLVSSPTYLLFSKISISYLALLYKVPQTGELKKEIYCPIVLEASSLK